MASAADRVTKGLTAQPTDDAEFAKLTKWQVVSKEPFETLVDAAQDLGKEFIEETYQQYFKDARKELINLENALANNDVNAFHMASHTLKGSAGSAASRRIYERCSAVADATKNQPSIAATGLNLRSELDQIYKEHRCYKKFFEAALAELDLEEEDDEDDEDEDD